MPQKVKLILNPMSDMGRAWKAANDLRPIAQEFKEGDISWSGTVYPTHGWNWQSRPPRKAVTWSSPWAETAPFMKSSTG